MCVSGVGLFDMITTDVASRFSPEIMFCFQFVLFLLLNGRIRFVRFSLGVAALFCSIFDVLPKSVGCSDFRTFSCQLRGTVSKWEYEIVFCCFLRKLRMSSSSVILQRLLQVGLLSSFSRMSSITHKEAWEYVLAELMVPCLIFR